MKKALYIIILCAGAAYAGTTLHEQSIPADWKIVTEKTQSWIQSNAAPIGTLVLNSNNKDLYVSLDAGNPGWRNVRLGTMEP